MKTTGIVIGWALTALCLASCGKAGGSDAAFVPAVDMTDALARIRAGNVSCGVDGGKCNEAVGMLALAHTIDKGYGIGMCTGTLISPTVIATNAHCIPVELRFAGESCEGRGDFMMPALAGKSAQRAHCSRILGSSQLLSAGDKYIRVSPDYAFVELDRPVVDRQPVAVSLKGLDDELKVSIYKSDPVDGDNIEGKITLTQCFVTQRTIVDPQLDDAFRRVGILTRCEGATEVMHGNSGSLVLDPSGAARALLQGGSDGGSTAHTIVTNFACIPSIPGLDRKGAGIPAACSVRNGSDQWNTR